MLNIWYWTKRKNNQHRWINIDCSTPIWWCPRFEKTIYGKRFGWLFFAIGTGLVTEEIMSTVKNNVAKKKVGE